MPLSEEQKARLRANMGKPLGQGRVQVGDPQQMAPGGLPPEIQAIVQGMPQGQPYIKSMGATPTIGFPTPQTEVQRQLTVDYAKQKMRGQAKGGMSDRMKQDFSKIDAFEGMMNDLEKVSSNVRKGPMKGRYVSGVANVTGGSEFGIKGLSAPLPDVSRAESENASTYDDLRPGVAVGLYRAVTGDDRVSDTDAAKRALPFIPPLTLSTEAFKKRMRFIKRAIQRKRRSIQKSAQTPGLMDTNQFSEFMMDAITEAQDD